MAVGKAWKDGQLLDNDLVQIDPNLATGQADRYKLSRLAHEGDTLLQGRL